MSTGLTVLGAVCLAGLTSHSIPGRIASFTQSAKRKTVLDYYLLLPDKYFEVDREARVKWMLNPKRRAIIDLANGYIYAPGDGAQTDVTVALFKTSHGIDFIGVKTHAPDTDEFTYLEFYLYQEGKWRDVTKRVLPVKVQEDLVYDIPRYGRMIKVSRRQGKRLYDLVWTGERFRLRKLPARAQE